MPPVARTLLSSAYRTLLEGATLANPGTTFDSRGYVSHWRQNLYSDAPFSQIEDDLSAGAGQELLSKFLAAHSSSALAVNTFAVTRLQPELLFELEASTFDTVRFEAACPTGLNGTPPHLDVLALGESVLGIESKCTEWLTSKMAKFSDSYLTLRQLTHTSWFAHMLELRRQPTRYRFLDAAQLIKHAFGLRTTYPDRPVKLLYLYWEPANATQWPECELHRAEIAAFADAISSDRVVFQSLSYSELWQRWGSNQPQWSYLQTRYAREA